MERVPIRLKSGSELNSLSHEELITRSFINAFLAVLWRRNYLTSIVYLRHNNKTNNKKTNKTNKEKTSIDKIFNQCMLFNLYSDLGWAKEVKPYLMKILLSGQIEREDIAKCSILSQVEKIFNQSYKIESSDRFQSLDFIREEYGKSVLDQAARNLSQEVKSLEVKYNLSSHTAEESLECNFCQQLEAYKEYKVSNIFLTIHEAIKNEL